MAGDIIVLHEHTLGIYRKRYNDFEILSTLISKGSTYNPFCSNVAFDPNDADKGKWRYANLNDFKEFRVLYNSYYNLKEELV